MKHLLTILLIAIAVNVSAQSYTIFENDLRRFNVEGKSVIQTTLTHYGEYSITNKVGITDYVFLTDNKGFGSDPWGELLIGLYYKPTKNTFLGVYAGMETAKPNYRFAVTGWWTITDNLTASIFYEKGQNHNDDYYDYNLKYQLYKKNHWSFFASGRYRQGYGIGIPLGVKYEMGKNTGKYLNVFYTTFYNPELSDTETSAIVPTLSLNIEL